MQAGLGFHCLHMSEDTFSFGAAYFMGTVSEGESLNKMLSPINPFNLISEQSIYMINLTFQFLSIQKCAQVFFRMPRWKQTVFGTLAASYVIIHAMMVTGCPTLRMSCLAIVINNKARQNRSYA